MKLRVVRTYTSWPVSAVWTTVSVAVAVLAAYSFLQPAWFVGAGRRPQLAFGALAVCYLNSTAGEARCSPHGAGASVVWQVTAVLCGGGCVMLAVGALVSLAHGFLSTHVWRKKASLIGAYVQATAGKVPERWREGGLPPPTCTVQATAGKVAERWRGGVCRRLRALCRSLQVKRDTADGGVVACEVSST